MTSNPASHSIQAVRGEKRPAEDAVGPDSSRTPEQPGVPPSFDPACKVPYTRGFAVFVWSFLNRFIAAARSGYISPVLKSR